MAGRFPDGKIDWTCIRAGRSRIMKGIERVRRDNRRSSEERGVWTAALMEERNSVTLETGRRAALSLFRKEESAPVGGRHSICTVAAYGRERIRHLQEAASWAMVLLQAPAVWTMSVPRYVFIKGAARSRPAAETRNEHSSF